VGLILEALSTSAIGNSTLVIFTTDHGIAFPGMKCTFFDSGIGVSLMLDYPGNPSKGCVVDALVSQIDLLPTICELANLESPSGIQGCSLVPLLERRKQTVGDEVFAEINYHVVYEPMRCIRSNRYKLIRYFGNCEHVMPANCDDSPSKDVFMEAGYFNGPRARMGNPAMISPGELD
jgi:arylsulfatase A-like enzyme